MKLSAYIIPGLAKQRPIDAIIVERMVCQAMELDPVKMREHKKWRKREYVEARYLVWTMLYRKYKWGQAKAGALYEKDHATVIHGMKKIDNLMQTDKDFRSKVDGLFNN